MNNPDNFDAIRSALSWLGVALALATAIVAVVRLRRSGAGLVIGASFGVLALSRLAFRWLAVPDVVTDENLDRVLRAALVSSLVGLAALLVLGVALLLYPRSLARSGPA